MVFRKERKTMKKRAAFLLACVMLAGIIAGCSFEKPLLGLEIMQKNV